MCGDDICSAEIGETCESCATDCCGIIFPAGATAGIVAFGVLVPSIVIMVLFGVSFRVYLCLLLLQWHGDWSLSALPTPVVLFSKKKTVL